MIKSWWFIFLSCCLFWNGSGLKAVENIPPCFADLEVNFFNYTLLAQAFSMNRISQSLVSSILTDLQQRSQQVPALVRDQARALIPNPLEYPFQVPTATALLKRTLHAVFRQSIIVNYALQGTNETAIGTMFEYIWFNQSQRLVQCLGEGAIVNQRVTE
jgi:hypothetical protein